MSWATANLNFVKDWTHLTHSGRFDMKRLKEVMLALISNDAPRGRQWLDHALVGDWADHRECQIGGDFLLIYQLQGGGVNAQVIFVRVGTHADRTLCRSIKADEPIVIAFDGRPVELTDGTGRSRPG